MAPSSQQFNRKKIRCGKCHTRMLDRFQTADEQWILHIKKGPLEFYTSWLVITCPHCRSRYRITAEAGIVERYTNANFEKKAQDATTGQHTARVGS